MENTTYRKSGRSGTAPPNLCGQRSCFAYRNGKCACLDDTDFGGKACPFYKTRKQYAAGLVAFGRAKPDDTEDDFLKDNELLMEEIAFLNAEADRMERGAVPEAMDEDAAGGDMDDDGWDDTGGS